MRFWDCGRRRDRALRSPDAVGTRRLAAIDKAVGKGKKWLADHFTVEPKSNWDLYYLYGLERFAALAAIKEIDGHDWYDEGAALLVRTQKGSIWNEGGGINVSTA